jgi:aldoxime dehydratase
MKDQDRAFEPAIPPHLELPRSRAKRMAEGYEPPHATFAARFRPSVLKVVMGYFGVQFSGAETPRVVAALDHLTRSFDLPNGPRHWDRARYVDEAQYTNIISVAYWDSPELFHVWMETPSNKAWWEAEARTGEDVGYFREIYVPGVEDYETAFSARTPEGIANLAPGMSGEIREHGYWGSARDRIPLAQVASLEPGGSLTADVSKGTFGKRIRVDAHENLCLIRSGQDWSDASAEDRRVYFEDLEPHLAAGMLFLRDKGKPIGCYANRFVRSIDGTGRQLDKTFCISLWRSLKDLERWAEFHPTHLAIFGAAIKYFERVGSDTGLRVYHEVTVVHKQDQSFEYVNCHGQTGLLPSVSVATAPD